MSKNKFNINDSLSQLKVYVDKISRFKILIFVIGVGLVYGYIIFQINSLVNQAPSSTQIQSNTSPLVGVHVNKTVVSQLESLQNNSVNVQTLFDQARTNPFQ